MPLLATSPRDNARPASIADDDSIKSIIGKHDESALLALGALVLRGSRRKWSLTEKSLTGKCLSQPRSDQSRPRISGLSPEDRPRIRGRLICGLVGG